MRRGELFWDSVLILLGRVPQNVAARIRIEESLFARILTRAGSLTPMASTNPQITRRLSIA